MRNGLPPQPAKEVPVAADKPRVKVVSSDATKHANPTSKAPKPKKKA
jgi:hypothetical protein